MNNAYSVLEFRVTLDNHRETPKPKIIKTFYGHNAATKAVAYAAELNSKVMKDNFDEKDIVQYSITSILHS